MEVSISLKVKKNIPNQLMNDGVLGKKHFKNTTKWNSVKKRRNLSAPENSFVEKKRMCRLFLV